MSVLMDSIEVPTLLLDEARVRRNLAFMVERAHNQGVFFRPHFKTHQSAEIGEWCREAGVQAITVSSVRMARYFVDAGWEDLTIAFPMNLRELSAINELASRAKIGVLVDSVESLHAMGALVDQPLSIWLEADTGYQRSGLTASGSSESVARFAELCAQATAFPNLTVRGFLSHSGHSYGYAGRSGHSLEELYAQTMADLQALRDGLAAAGHSGLLISLGDTPMSSVVADLYGIDEMRPGNFIFYDWMQYAFGSCAQDQIAVAMAAPVVANYPERNEVIIYGGAVHLGKELLPRADGSADYGHIAPITGDGWGAAFEDVWLRSLSQEHGIIRGTPEAYDRDLAGLRPGDLVAVLPIHSCLTADLLKEYLTLDGRRISMMHYV